MNVRQNLKPEEKALAEELVETYKIEREDIIFFEGDPKPFLMYEANCVLCNSLTNLIHIGVEPVPSAFADSVSVKCSIILQNGNERTAVAVANLQETIHGNKITEPQALSLASSRALRSVLRAAGIDLLKLHERVKKGENILDFTPQSIRTSLLGQAHLLGVEKLLIVGDDKTLWQQSLWIRYCVRSSSELSETQLPDWIAFLQAYEPPLKNGAAAAAKAA